MTITTSVIEIGFDTIEINLVVVVVHVVVVVNADVDPRNLPLKFGLNQVINR